MPFVRQEIKDIYLWDELQDSVYLWDILVRWWPRPEPCLFCYTWTEQYYTVPKKWIYKLQVWWAQGWYYSSNPYGKWWYSEWCICLDANTCLYIYVWWQWCSWYNWAVAAWWWNWGWCWYSYSWRYDWWWGWGTDIRIWWNTIYYRRIVAWWGWGSWQYSSYIWCWWVWWWTNWITWWTAYSSYYWWNWWTQVSGWAGWWNWQYMIAWSFWQWGYKTAWSSWYNGSWWWGWRYWWWPWSAVSAWGWWGSWYVYTSSTCSNAPSWYCHCSNYYLINAYTCAWDTTFPDISWWTETWHVWCWYAIICFIC